MKRLLFAAVLVAVVACATQEAPLGATAPCPKLSPCAAACANLAAHDCPDAKPTPAGASCVEVCENVNASGTIPYPSDCVSKAKSCGAAEACFR